MTRPKNKWTEQVPPVVQKWMKQLLPLAIRLKKAEANFKRRPEK
jgi:hypothetical protein